MVVFEILAILLSRKKGTPQLSLLYLSGLSKWRLVVVVVGREILWRTGGGGGWDGRWRGERDF